MNNIRKSELKQSVIAALSTFPCPVTVPEILHKLARMRVAQGVGCRVSGVGINETRHPTPAQGGLNSLSYWSAPLNFVGLAPFAPRTPDPKGLDRAELTRPELTELLEEMILEGEAEKFPVNRYACHHVWDSTNKERRCSRCHRVEPIKPTEEEAMNTDIEILTDSEIIASELLEEEEEKDRQEAISLKAEIIKLMADFFVALGEKLKIYQEKRLYRFEADNFGAWCEQELRIKRDYAYK